MLRTANTLRGSFFVLGIKFVTIFTNRELQIT